jgi:hypothetical protein
VKYSKGGSLIWISEDLSSSHEAAKEEITLRLCVFA